MKTIKNLLFVAFAAISITACQKELADSNANNGSQNRGPVVTFTGSLDEVETKTTIWYDNKRIEAGKCPTMFMIDDYITVNGVKSGKMNKLDEHGTQVSFNVEGVTGPYYAVTAAQNKGYENGVYTVQVNGTGKAQAYRLVNSEKSISFDSNADILAAYSEDKTLHFKHMTTFYAISVDTENSSVKSNIRSIYIRQAGDAPNIAGQWSLSFEGENHVPTLTPKSLSALIAYDCSQKDADGNPQGVAQGKVMMVGVPAYNFDDGLIITLKDINGKFASYKIPASQTQFADKGGVIIPFKPKFNPGAGKIMSAKDWNEFADFINDAPTKDWDIYRWIGDGSNTITLGADINDDEVELKSITKEFKYIFDGNGKTITRKNAISSLFSDLTGEIRNLTLDGNLTLSKAEDAPFVKNIYAGAKITGCTNNMDVTFDIKADGDVHCYVTGIAAVGVRNDTEGLELLEISNCTNNGKIEGIVDVSSANCNVAVAGIIGDVRAGTGKVLYDVLLKDCTNNGEIKLSPKSGDDSTKGMSLCGVGGIVGYLRNSKSVTLDNCDNTKPITLSAENISSTTGLKAGATAVGGIVGLGTNAGGGLSLTGQKITLLNCNNSATIYNCAVNASAGEESDNKVYTGGLAGALVGKADSYVAVTSCTNTGNVFTYDVCGENAATTSATSAVAGGFIGFGGYLKMEDCTVKCQLGNGKRQSVAWGGVLGFAMTPFDLIDSEINVVGYFNRIQDYNLNRAVIAVIPVKFGSSGPSMSPAPTITKSSTISGSSVTCKMLTTTGYTDTTDNLRESTDKSFEFTSDPFKGTDGVKKNLTRGVGSSGNAVINIGDGNTFKLGTL